MNSLLRPAGGIVAAATILGLCSQIRDWWFLLDFFGLVPWLVVLGSVRTLRGAAACGLAMAMAYVVAIFVWFGVAIAVYSAGAVAAGVAVLLLSSPILQPQFVVFAIVRHLAARSLGPALVIVAGASAWVATEWAFPKLLADNLAHGLYPSPVLRQVAALGGTAGITFLLVVVNECLALAWTAAQGSKGLRSRAGVRAALAPAAVAAAIVAAMAAYGWARLAALEAAEAEARGREKPLRVGMLQTNIASYDRLRREMGTYGVARHVLDTHFTMSRLAVERDRVDALLWSETVYPTTFGKPRSEDGAALDGEIEALVGELGVPLVFGAYDTDEGGDYNAAVFLSPAPRGEKPAHQVYRKTRLFLFTEYVPWWMDGAFARWLMPWAGTWKPGDGARVLGLVTADGREIPVQPMICLDDVDTTLAIDGARLGARAILTMSNDSWFSEAPAGAWLHLVVAAYRSVETGLPQFRVTNTGITTVLDPSGEILATGAVGERAIVVGEMVPGVRVPTLLVRWGDWVGPTGLVVAAALLALARLRQSRRED